MLETHAARVNAVNRYNEVVVDTKVAVDGEKGYEKRARDAVALFRTRFKREPHEFPLLSLDLSKAHQPFTEVG